MIPASPATPPDAADMPHLQGAKTAAASPAVRFKCVSLAFDDVVVLRGISFQVPEHCMLVLLGASGAGKSIVLKLILGLLRPDSGEVWVLGHRIDTMAERDLMRVRSQIGMVFQEGALFDSLTVAENVGYRLWEDPTLQPAVVERRVQEVLAVVDLSEYADRLPAELSGGQRRRVAIARAMAPRPRLLLFDEPTTGLDPITARTVDDEIITSRDLEHATSILVTHQLRDAFYVAAHEARVVGDRLVIVPAGEGLSARVRFLMLKDGTVHFEGDAAALRASPDAYVKAFLS